MTGRRLAWIAVTIAIVFVVAIRVRLADTPLERDEGEYTYAGQLILQGVPPYQLAYNMKFPGVYYANAAIEGALGDTARDIHFGLAALNAATILLIFLLGRRTVGLTAGACAAALYGLLSIDRSVEGIAAHATHFVVLPVVAALVVLSGARAGRAARRRVAAGLLLGVAVLMKQQAALFVPFIVAGEAWITWRATSSRRDALRDAMTIGASALLPLGALAIVLAAQGVFGRFVFWTFTYARAYLSEMSLSDAMSLGTFAVGFVTAMTWPIWMAAAVGLVLIWRGGVDRPAAIRLTALGLGGAAAVCPGFYFRPHYFILLLPFVALAAGVACDATGRLVARGRGPGAHVAATLTVAVLLAGIYVWKDSAFLFDLSPREASRAIYPANPFIEAEDISTYLRAHTTAADRIAVLGSEPEIYAESGRRAATGYIYTYGLMEPQPYAARMQNEMMHEVETAHPAYLVVVLARNSWLGRDSSDPRILEWMTRYTAACYDHIEAGDIGSGPTAALRWEPHLAGYEPRTLNRIDTYRRRGTAPCVAPR